MILARFSRSASLRLSFLVAVVISTLSLVSLAIQYQQVTAEFDRRQIEGLQSDLNAYFALYEQRRIISLRQAMELRAAAKTGYEQIYLLLDKQDRFLGGNIPAWPAGVTAVQGGFDANPNQQFTLVTPDGKTTQFIGVARELRGGFPLLVGRSLDGRNRFLAGMRRMILAVGIGMIALSLLAGWLVSRMVLARITKVNDLADQVAQGALDARISGPRSDDEFGRLESHVHHMLDRIEALQKATGQLSDAIAHELRTPLNRIRQKLGQIKGQDQLARALEAELRTTVRVFEALLDIAAAEGATGSKPGLKPVDLSAICHKVFDLYEPMAEDLGLNVAAKITPDLWVLGDENLIAQLLSNLIDNALKFCRAGDNVDLRLDLHENAIRLLVADTGPGVAPDLPKDEIFERFSRANRDHQVAGHGLGLALVKAIATRHGAKLRIVPVEKGFAVECIWPRSDGLLQGQI